MIIMSTAWTAYAALQSARILERELVCTGRARVLFDAAREQQFFMQVLADEPGARRQMMEAHVRQDWSLTPQAWQAWWDALALRCRLLQNA